MIILIIKVFHKTPLQQAFENGNEEIIQLITDHIFNKRSMK